jgi:hypothetical protein
MGWCERLATEPDFALARVLDGSCDMIQGAHIRYRQWAVSRREAEAASG